MGYPNRFTLTDNETGHELKLDTYELFRITNALREQWWALNRAFGSQPCETAGDIYLLLGDLDDFRQGEDVEARHAKFVEMMTPGGKRHD